MMNEMKQPKRRPAGGGDGDGDGWRRWGAPAMMALFFLGFVVMRSANPCGPRACPISTPSILTGYEMPRLDAPANGTMPSAVESEIAVADPSPFKTDRLATFFLHGTIRCEECREIERIAEYTIAESYPEAMAEESIIWQSLNIDLPENAEYEQQFKPPSPSLVLAVVAADGQIGKWKILGRTWELIDDDPTAIETYIRQEIKTFLETNSPDIQLSKPTLAPAP